MAYFNQERKSQKAPAIKAILKKYGVKGSLAVRHHSTFVLNIKSGSIDFIENYIKTDADKNYGNKMDQNQIDYIRNNKALDVNPYWYQEHYTGKALSFLKEVFKAMNAGNHDNSDIQSDYFDVGWYVDVNIGQWNKPYEVEGSWEKVTV
jgi:hypothetical protein